MTFQRGVSGNPAGRPRGSRNKAKIYRESVTHEDIQTVMRHLVDLAKDKNNDKNFAAMRLFFQLVGPPRRGELVDCDLPPLKSPVDVLEALQTIASDVAVGELTTAAGADLGKLMGQFLQTFANLNFERRLRAVEKVDAARGLQHSPAEAEPGSPVESKVSLDNA